MAPGWRLLDLSRLLRASARFVSALAVCLGLSCCSAPDDESRPNIVLLVIDTLRADLMPFNGGPAGVAPFLSRFAESGVVFENAWSTSSWTAPATASMFSGV